MNWILSTRMGFVCCIIAAVLLASLGNLFLAITGWPSGTEEEIMPAECAWVDHMVGFVWLVLFAV